MSAKFYSKKRIQSENLEIKSQESQGKKVIAETVKTQIEKLQRRESPQK